MAAEVRIEVSRLILKEEAARLEKALELLEPVQREVILLRKYEELSFQEIGERLGKSQDACRMLPEDPASPHEERRIAFRADELFIDGRDRCVL